MRTEALARILDHWANQLRDIDREKPWTTISAVEFEIRNLARKAADNSRALLMLEGEVERLTQEARADSKGAASP